VYVSTISLFRLNAIQCLTKKSLHLEDVGQGYIIHILHYKVQGRVVVIIRIEGIVGFRGGIGGYGFLGGGMKGEGFGLFLVKGWVGFPYFIQGGSKHLELG
jgi:hypothetical protein